jgi:hypothetical protein
MKSDEYNEVALASMLAVRALRPTEKRLWVPLYLLMREYSLDEEIKDYLREIIPLIEREPAALRDYPLTLESLKAEFNRLIGKIGSEYDLSEQDLADARASVPQAAGGESLPVMVEPQLHVEPIRLAESFGDETAFEDSITKRILPEDLASLKIVDIEPFDSSESLTGYEQGSLNTRHETQVDWRECVRKREIPDNFAASVLNRPFSSAIEKHVAIQVAALVSGDMDVLEDWHWQVWRSPDQFGYTRSGKERYPSEMNPELIYSPLHRTMLYLAPVFVKLYQHRFKKAYLCRKLEVDAQQLVSLIRPMDWEHPLFRETGLVHYLETIRRQKFKIYDAKGLGSKIFYEGSVRSIYIDTEYYSKKPPSVVFHRIYGLLWAIKMRYFVLLHLDPVKHLYSGYMELRKAVSEGGLAWIKSAVVGGYDPVHVALSAVDRSELKRQMERVGDVRPESMSALWLAMNEHIYRLLLAETLDVVGIFEGIAGKDFVEGKRMKPLEVIDQSPYFSALLDYITYLKL